MRRLSKKTIFISIFALLFVVIIFVNSVANIGSSNIFTESYGGFSVAFDKKEIKTVDRVVISIEDQEVVITDTDFVNLIVNETKVATHIGISCPEDRRIDLYCGDKLIRTMGWSTCCDTVHVYNADATHWIFSIEGCEEAGFIYLTDTLIEKINDIFDY